MAHPGCDVLFDRAFGNTQFLRDLALGVAVNFLEDKYPPALLRELANGVTEPGELLVRGYRVVRLIDGIFGERRFEFNIARESGRQLVLRPLDMIKGKVARHAEHERLRFLDFVSGVVLAHPNISRLNDVFDVLGWHDS